MRPAPLLLALACAWSLAAAQPPAPPPVPPLDEARHEAQLHQFLRELRCVVCQNESLADSTAPLAMDLKREITQRLAAGQSPQQVRDWLTQRYGDFISYTPPLKASTGLLWAGPALLALLGVVVVLRSSRRRALLQGDDA